MSAPMTAIGIGCRKDCPAEAIVALVRKALAHPALAGAGVMAVFTTVDKQSEPGIAAAAAALALPLVFLPRAALEAVAPAAQTRSERVVSLFGVPSVAETAALAGAGPGARLLVPRISADGASCAVAGPAPRPEESP